jgi:hypothetical protein
MDLRKQAIATELIEDALEEGSALVSFQVVQEVLNYLTRRPNRPLASLAAEDIPPECTGTPLARDAERIALCTNP